MENIILEAKGISKAFPGIQALEKVDFKLKAGSVHAIVGENGAGKSTLMNILMGIYTRDDGEIVLRNSPVSFSFPKQALEAGIAIIAQELNPIHDMTVAENIFLGRESVKYGLFVDYGELNRKAEKILEILDVKIDVTKKMKYLSLAETQLVEIAKAISYDTDVLIMDEPTSAIGEKEVEQLFAVIGRLKKQGKGIIYVSHRMEEIFTITDEITVLRDGKYIGTENTSEIGRSRLISMMIGRKLEEEFIKENNPSGNVLLKITGLKSRHVSEKISMEVHKGEILGIFGLMGSGRSEFFQALFGIDKNLSGMLEIDGKRKVIKSPFHAIKAGMAFVTEDRKESGLVLNASVRDNISIAALKAYENFLFINGKKENIAVNAVVDLFRVKTPSLKQIVRNLSGGNQQKVVLSKWLLTNPKILLLDEPTRGIDVGAKREIYKFMSEFASRGNAVIMISSELPEILGMSDSILVFKNGRVSAKLSRKEADQHSLMHHAS